MTHPLATAPRWRERLTSGDRRAVAWLVAIPTLLFVIPALAGHPAIVADNLIQNFPLRALAGRQLAGGHLPLFNPYADSGTPLLGGLNAGALYPTTLFFLVPWSVAAWTANLIVVYAGAAIGVYALARYNARGVRASFLAALTFMLFGAMTGQIVHLGVIQGYSMLPWALLALVALSRRLARAETAGHGLLAAAAPPLVGFALTWGLVCLSGEPRAIAELELLTLIVVPAILLLRSSYRLATWRARFVFVLSAGVAVLWGVAIGLVQLLPGWSFIGFSQRSTISYWFFGSGSMAVRWTSLLFVQDLFGSNGLLGTPRYFVGYNLPEVTGYAGLLALMGVAAFLTRVTRRGWVGEDREATLYGVVGFVGLWATWGNFTPVGHLFRAIPLFGSTRLQSRNVILVDLAAAMLLAWWVDRLESGSPASAGLVGARRHVTLAPVYVVVALCVAALGWGPSLINLLAKGVTHPVRSRHEVLTLVLHLVIALGALALVLGWRRLARPMRWLTAVFVADLLVFLVFCTTGLVGGYTIVPSTQTASAALGTQGRVGMVDALGHHGRDFQALGEPNMNVFTRLASVQGYGSLISSIYNKSTGTHRQEQLNPCEMVKGTFTQLRLSAIAVATEQLLTTPGRVLYVPAYCKHQRPAPVTSRYFGQVLSVSQITLAAEPGAPLARGPLTIRVLSADGRVVKSLTLGHLIQPKDAIQAIVVDLNGVRGAGFELLGRDVAIGHATVMTTGTHPVVYELNSPFEIALSTSSWRLASTPNTYSIFRATHVKPADWLQGATAGQRVTKIRNAAWGDSWVGVDAPSPVTLVRSMAYLPGWRATAVNSVTGHSVDLRVARHGLIQSVEVPAGTLTVHFHYHAPHIEIGVVASAAASFLWLAGVGWLLTRARRRRTASIRS